MTELTEAYVSPDPLLWRWNQYKYYVQPGYLRMRPDEVAHLRLYLSSTYMPIEPCGLLTHAEYFDDLDLTRSAGWPSLNTKAWFWNHDYNRAINCWERFVETGELPPVIGVVSPKLNETLAPTKVTRLVVCLPAEIHYCEKRVFEPILETHRQDPWRGGVRVGTSMRGEAHRIFNDFKDDDEVYECDLTGQEFCHNDDVTGLLSWLCQRQSTRPDLVRALFDANRRMRLLFPDGTVTDATPAEKSGSMYTLTGNSVCTETQWVRAHYNIALVEGFDYDPEHLKLHIIGDNTLVALRGPLAGRMLAFQMLFRTYGFHLKVQRSAGRGAWGLVWCGFTKEGPREWLKFTKPLKMLAKAYYDAPDAERCKQQLLAVYTLCWNTPLRDVAAQALERLKRQYGTPYVLPSYFDVQCTLAEGIEQGRGGFSFSTSAVVPLRAKDSVHNGQRGPPNKRVTMPKGYSKRGAKAGAPMKKRIMKAVKKVERKARPVRAQRPAARPVRVSRAAAPAKIEFDYHPFYSRKETRDGCIVEYSDLAAPVQGGILDVVLSQSFSLDIREQTLQNPGSVMAKLRQESSMWARYQVLGASLVYVPKVGTAINGAVGIGIVPGEIPAPSTSRELATFWGAAYGSVGAMHKTAVWKPKESRLFNTDRAGPDNLAQKSPFTIVTVTEGLSGLSAPNIGVGVTNVNSDIGELFIRVKLRFQDATPPPSNQLALYTQAPFQSETPAAGPPSIPFDGLNAMTGDFSWQPNGSTLRNYISTAADLPLVQGASCPAAQAATAVVPNKFFFDLEPGIYDVYVTLGANAAVDVKTADMEEWVDGKRELTPTGPNAAGDVTVSLVAKEK